jgi:CBS domain-containing protein
VRTIGGIVADREVYHIADDQSVRDAARYMTERRVGAVAVLTGDRLAGILSERDIMGRVVALGLDLDKTRVGEYQGLP